jgi:hypothetical protein
VTLGGLRRFGHAYNGADETLGTSADMTAAESTDNGDTSETGIEMVNGVSLPQAINGAFYVDTSVYAEIPIHVLIDGTPDAVTVTVDTTDHAADDTDGDGDWSAMLPVLGSGLSQVMASAGGMDASAELGRGTTGLQFTSQTADGSAITPRVHRVGDEMFISGAALRCTRYSPPDEAHRLGRRVDLDLPERLRLRRCRAGTRPRAAAIAFGLRRAG